MSDRTEILEQIVAKARRLRDLERSLGKTANSSGVFARLQERSSNWTNCSTTSSVKNDET